MDKFTPADLKIIDRLKRARARALAEGDKADTAWVKALPSLPDHPTGEKKVAMVIPGKKKSGTASKPV